MTMINKLSAFAPIALLLVACSGDADVDTSAPAGASTPAGGTSPDPSAPPPGSPAPVDAAPRLVSTTPGEAAQGVRDDATIVLRFDRAMDGASVEAAYASASLPASDVTFAWSGNGDVLTITPKAKLQYVEGGLDSQAKVYAIEIGVGAKDTSGRALAAPAKLSFTTLRKLTVSVPIDVTASGTIASNAVGAPGVLRIGDLLLKGVELQTKGVLSFSLASLPASLELTSASLGLEEADLAGSPDAALGSLSTAHVTGIASLDMNAFGTSALSTALMARVGAFNGNPPFRSSNVTAMVADDLANRAARGQRSQFRFAYSKASDLDGAEDSVTLGKPTLTLRGLAP